MKCIRYLVSVIVLAATAAASAPSVAETRSPAGVNAKTASPHKKAMHPDTLTLYPHGRPKRQSTPHRYTRHPFNQPSPTHNTFAAPRYY